MIPERLLEEELVLAADADPSGACVWSVRRPRADGRGYDTELWRRPPGGEPGHVPLPFPLSAAPRCLPDGRIAVVGEQQLWIAGDPPQRLTEDHCVLDAEPAPDGSAIAFRALTGEERFRVGGDVARHIRSPLVLADGVGFRDRWIGAFLWREGEVAPLSTGEHAVHACGWSDDGSELWLLVGLLRDRPYEVHELWTVRPGEAPRLAVVDPGFVVDAALSPDASRLAWISRPDFSTHSRLRVLDRRSGTVTRLDHGLCADQSTFPDLLPPADPRMHLAWTADGSAVLAIATVRGRPLVYRFPLDGEPAPELPGVSVGFLRRAGDTTLVIGTEDAGAADVRELGGARVSRHAGWLGELPRVTELSTDRSGAEVHGWVVEPEDAPADAPLILHIHGGPYSAHGPVLWLEMIALAARGYRVLVPNPRGSVSYGEDFSTAIVGRWGTVDADDLHAFLDAALERGLGDPGRLGVLGLSYGGYMTAHLLGTSGRFAAAVAENPVTNFVSAFGMSDLGLLGAQLALGHEEVDVDAMWAVSPLRRVREITTPLLLLQGEADDRCPLPESMQLYSALQALGREAELIRFPEESHMMFQLARPDRRVYRLRAILDWFDAHLG